MEVDRLEAIRHKAFNYSSLDAEILEKYNLTEYVKKLGELWKNGEIYQMNSVMDNFTTSHHPYESNSNNYYKICYGNGTVRNIATMYRGIHGYTSLLVCIFGTMANLFNIIVLTRKQMKNAPFAYILTWLAIADMLLMMEYIPFVCYMHLTPNSKMEKFSYEGAIYILIHTYFSQVLHTISICLTLTLAFWRYNAIRYPEKSPTLWTREKCTKMVRLALIFPVIICTPSYFTFSVHSTIIYGDQNKQVLYYLDLSELAKSNHELFYISSLWLYAVVIKLLPCVILAVISLSLIQALNKTVKRRQKLQNSSNTSLEGKLRIRKNKRKTDRSSQMLIAILFLFLITEFPQCILGLLSGILGKWFFRHCYHLFGEIMDILALINGAINFILYCIMSKQFRLAFKQIFGKMQISQNSSCKESETYI